MAVELLDKGLGWETVVLDELEETMLAKTVAFLSGFTPAGSDPVWSLDSLKWKLGEGNPAGRGFLTCAVSEGKVVGVVSATRKRLWIKGSEVPGAEVGDTYTHPDFVRRRPASGEPPDFLKHSIFGRLATETRIRAMNGGVRVLYGTPNANARPGWEKRLGYRVHPLMDNRSFIRPTARGLANRMGWGAGAAFSLGEGLVEPLLQAIWKAIRRFGRYSVEPMTQADGDLDRLWDRLKGQHPFSLVRDRAYFQHRFFDPPLGRYQMLRISKNRRLEGVMAARVFSTPWGKRYCCLADWLVDESKAPLFPLLAAHLVREHRRSPIDGFYLWCGNHRNLRTALRRIGFFRSSASPVIFYQDSEGKKLTEECGDLDFTLGSSDNV